MIPFELGLGTFVVALWVFCLVDVVCSGEGAVRGLRRIPWLLIVLFLPCAGSVAWLVAGRPLGAPARSPYEPEAPHVPADGRPGRAIAEAEADEEFLRRVRARAEDQRRAYRAGLEREEQERLQRGLRRTELEDPDDVP